MIWAPPTLPTAIVAPESNGICLAFDASYSDAPIMRIRRDAPGGRVHLQDDAKPCPPSVACKFVRKAYLTPGDYVLVSAPIGGFRCAYFGAHGRLSTGFVPVASLEAAPDNGAAATPEFLSGRWRDGDDTLVFVLKGKTTAVEGEAYWPGREPAYRPDGSLISVHEGDVEGEVRLVGDRIDIGSEDDCHVWGRRRGPYLIIDDNGHCGGMNVRFSGLYVRAASR